MSYVEIPMAEYRRRLLSLHAVGEQTLHPSSGTADGRRRTAVAPRSE